MKIGIITFHSAHNYGAVLQAYALQEFLKSHGNDVEIIDYRPKSFNSNFPAPRLENLSRAQKILRWIFCIPKNSLSFPFRVRRSRGFKKFISEKMQLSREQFSESDRVPELDFDALVFGSDQIWNHEITHGIDKIFVGNFRVPEKTKKISYAASAGGVTKTLGENQDFVSELKNFDEISVREQELAEVLQPKFPKKIETVVDPTLLVEKSLWDKIAHVPAEKKYVLVYKVSGAQHVDEIARKIAKILDAKIVEISSGQIRPNIKITETPEQFLGWFKNADFVVTTSFHGTAFSIANKKPFFYVGNGNAGENRSKQILSALGLSERFVVGSEFLANFGEGETAERERERERANSRRNRLDFGRSETSRFPRKIREIPSRRAQIVARSRARVPEFFSAGTTNFSAKTVKFSRVKNSLGKAA